MPYPILEIDPTHVLESEQLGTKDKFWLRIEESDKQIPHDSEWLFKFPTQGTGQHWAEKIAYEIARRMNVLAPRVELAIFEGHRGSITENFATDGYELFHGNQVLSGYNSSYEQERRFHQNDHTIGQIFEAIQTLFHPERSGKKACEKLAGYLILDALICNVDRHHENWGFLRKLTDGKWKGRLAPSYDHASSLGRELQDKDTKQNRQRYLQELGIAKYLERGRGPVFIDGTGKYGPSPLRLIERCLQIPEYADYFRPGLSSLSRLNSNLFEEIIAGIPPSWMTPLAREFALCLLSETLNRLNLLAP